jgi:hypothetical protein
MARKTKVIKEKLVEITQPDVSQLSWWGKVKHWSGWSAAGTIFIARMETASGFLLAVLGGLDWSSLMALDFSNGINTPQMIGGGILVVKGIVTEMTRRNNAVDL